jgi:hypothetical protein
MDRLKADITAEVEDRGDKLDRSTAPASGAGGA